MVRYVYCTPPLCDVPLEDVIGPAGRAIQSYLAGEAYAAAQNTGSP